MVAATVPTADEASKGKGGKGKGAKGKGKSKGKTHGVGGDDQQKCVLWVVGHGASAELAVIWKGTQLQPRGLVGVDVKITNAKPIKAEETGTTLLLEGQQFVTKLPNQQAGGSQIRVYDSQIPCKQEALCLPTESIAKILMYVQSATIAYTRTNTAYMQVHGVGQYGDTLSLKLWSHDHDDGSIVSGNTYLVHGLKVLGQRVKDYWGEYTRATDGRHTLEFSAQWTAFEDVSHVQELTSLFTV